MLHFIFSHPVEPIGIQESNLNLSSSFRIFGFSALRSDRSHIRSGIFSTDATHASGSIIIFVRQGLSFSEFSTSSLSSLDPCSDYVEINISLNNSSSLSFLDVYAFPIHSSPRDSRTDFFSPSILPSSTNVFIMRDCIYHHPHWDSKGTSDSRGEEVFKWVISYDLLNDPDLPTLLHRSSGSPSSPDTSFALSFLASGRCFSTWILITYQFCKPSLFLLSFAPTNVPLPSIFNKLVEMTLLFTLTVTVLLHRNTRLFLFPLLLLSLIL